MFRSIAIRGMGLILLAGVAPAWAAEDATIPQVYEAARSGHLAQAEGLISQVLRDNPESAKAHYVAAEVYAYARDFATARRELSAAERLSPGLPFVRPDSAAALRRELTRPVPMSGIVAPRAPSVPWGPVVVILAGVAIAWAILRRRQQTYAYSQYPSSLPPTAGAPLAGPVIGGGGPGIMGSLATGLAVGAGVAAGEELVRHVVGGDHSGGIIPTAGAEEWQDNRDLGGDNFGITGGGGWDDGGSGSFGGDVGGSDWT